MHSCLIFEEMEDMRLRNQKLDVKGRSLLLNVVGIILNIVGVVLVVIGFHEYTEDGFILKLAGTFLIVASLAGLVMLKGLYLFSYVSRVLVGGLFIVSGLVKANDPWGFAFKLEEYFSPIGLGADYPFVESFAPYVLELSIFICIVEIVLGAALILGGKIKLASWSLVLMMFFFTWLTWYTSSCVEQQELALQLGQEFSRDCVTDCGCFGDALKGSVGRSLTPLESFWKDLILFYFVLIIFVNQWKIEMNTVKENWVMTVSSMVVIIFFSWVFGWYFPIFFALFALLGAFVIGRINIGKMGKAWKMALYVTVVSFIFSLYTSMYLPVKDYRAYAIGNNIHEQMNNGRDAVIDMVYVYSDLENGGEINVPLGEYMDNWEKYSDTTKYEMLERKDVPIDEGQPHSIMDFQPIINYEALSEDEKQIAYIDSLIQMDYDFYYEEKMVVSSIYGGDTIAAIDFDTLYYPDSMYTAGEPYVALSDPHASWDIDMTPVFKTEKVMFMMTIRDIESMNEAAMDDLKLVLAGAKENKIPFYVLTPATDEQVAELKEKFEFDATFLSIDGTEVKIIVRSNPGLVLLKEGTIIDKWPSRSIPDFDSIFEDHIQGK